MKLKVLDFLAQLPRSTHIFKNSRVPYSRDYHTTDLDKKLMMTEEQPTETNDVNSGQGDDRAPLLSFPPRNGLTGNAINTEDNPKKLSGSR